MQASTKNNYDTKLMCKEIEEEGQPARSHEIAIQ